MTTAIPAQGLTEEQRDEEVRRRRLDLLNQLDTNPNAIQDSINRYLTGITPQGEDSEGDDDFLSIDRLADQGKRFASGVQSTIGGISSFGSFASRHAGFDELAESFQNTADSYRESAENIKDTLSPEGKRELNAKFLTTDFKNESIFTDPGAAIGTVAEALPSVGASVVAATFAGGLIGFVVGGPLGMAAGAKLGMTGATALKVTQAAVRIGGGIAAAATEGAISGGMTANEIAGEVQKLTDEQLTQIPGYEQLRAQGMTNAEVREMARNSLQDSTVPLVTAVTGILGGLSGGTIAGATTKIAKTKGGVAAIPSRASRFKTGFKAEASTEALQSGFEVGITNVQAYNNPALEGVAEAMVAGGLTGGVIGGGIAAVPSSHRAAAKASNDETLQPNVNKGSLYTAEDFVDVKKAEEQVTNDLANDIVHKNTDLMKQRILELSQFYNQKEINEWLDIARAKAKGDATSADPANDIDREANEAARRQLNLPLEEPQLTPEQQQIQAELAQDLEAVPDITEDEAIAADLDQFREEEFLSRQLELLPSKEGLLDEAKGQNTVAGIRTFIEDNLIDRVDERQDTETDVVFKKGKRAGTTGKRTTRTRIGLDGKPITLKQRVGNVQTTVSVMGQKLKQLKTRLTNAIEQAPEAITPEEQNTVNAQLQEVEAALAKIAQEPGQEPNIDKMLKRIEDDKLVKRAGRADNLTHQNVDDFVDGLSGVLDVLESAEAGLSNTPEFSRPKQIRGKTQKQLDKAKETAGLEVQEGVERPTAEDKAAVDIKGFRLANRNPGTKKVATLSSAIIHSDIKNAAGRGFTQTGFINNGKFYTSAEATAIINERGTRAQKDTIDVETNRVRGEELQAVLGIIPEPVDVEPAPETEPAPKPKKPRLSKQQIRDKVVENVVLENDKKKDDAALETARTKRAEMALRALTKKTTIVEQMEVLHDKFKIPLSVSHDQVMAILVNRIIKDGGKAGLNQDGIKVYNAMDKAYFDLENRGAVRQKSVEAGKGLKGGRRAKEGRELEILQAKDGVFDRLASIFHKLKTFTGSSFLEQPLAEKVIGRDKIDNLKELVYRAQRSDKHDNSLRTWLSREGVKNEIITEEEVEEFLSAIKLFRDVNFKYNQGVEGVHLQDRDPLGNEPVTRAHEDLQRLNNFIVNGVREKGGDFEKVAQQLSELRKRAKKTKIGWDEYAKFLSDAKEFNIPPRMLVDALNAIDFFKSYTVARGEATQVEERIVEAENIDDMQAIVDELSSVEFIVDEAFGVQIVDESDAGIGEATKEKAKAVLAPYEAELQHLTGEQREELQALLREQIDDVSIEEATQYDYTSTLDDEFETTQFDDTLGNANKGELIFEAKKSTNPLIKYLDAWSYLVNTYGTNGAIQIQDGRREYMGNIRAIANENANEGGKNKVLRISPRLLVELAIESLHDLDPLLPMYKEYKNHMDDISKVAKKMGFNESVNTMGEVFFLLDKSSLKNIPKDNRKRAVGMVKVRGTTVNLERKGSGKIEVTDDGGFSPSQPFGISTTSWMFVNWVQGHNASTSGDAYLNTEVIAHEFAHLFTSQVRWLVRQAKSFSHIDGIMNTIPKKWLRAENDLQKLHKFLKKVRKQRGKSNDPRVESILDEALLNPDELIAYGFTETYFQRWLATIKIPKSKFASMWAMFKDIVFKRFLGVRNYEANDTALEQVMILGRELFGSDEIVQQVYDSWTEPALKNLRENNEALFNSILTGIKAQNEDGFTKKDIRKIKNRLLFNLDEAVKKVKKAAPKAFLVSSKQNGEVNDARSAEALGRPYNGTIATGQGRSRVHITNHTETRRGVVYRQVYMLYPHDIRERNRRLDVKYGDWQIEGRLIPEHMLQMDNTRPRDKDTAQVGKPAGVNIHGQVVDANGRVIGNLDDARAPDIYEPDYDMRLKQAPDTLVETTGRTSERAGEKMIQVWIPWSEKQLLEREESGAPIHGKVNQGRTQWFPAHALESLPRKKGVDLKTSPMNKSQPKPNVTDPIIQASNVLEEALQTAENTEEALDQIEKSYDNIKTKGKDAGVRGVLGHMMLDAINSTYGHLFRNTRVSKEKKLDHKGEEVSGNTLNNVIQFWQEKQALARKFQREQDPILVKWREVAEEHPTDEAVMNELQVEATIHGVHPDLDWSEIQHDYIRDFKNKKTVDVKRQKHQALRKQYLGLHKDVRTQYQALENFYRDTYNEFREHSLRQIAKAIGVDFEIPAVREALLESKSQRELEEALSEQQKTVIEKNHREAAAKKRAVVAEAKEKGWVIRISKLKRMGERGQWGFTWTREDAPTSISLASGDKVGRHQVASGTFKEIANFIVKMNTLLDKSGPYFPLRRYGEWVFEVKHTTKVGTFPDAATVTKAKSEAKAHTPSAVFEVRKNEDGTRTLFQTEHAFMMYETRAEAVRANNIIAKELKGAEISKVTEKDNHEYLNSGEAELMIKLAEKNAKRNGDKDVSLGLRQAFLHIMPETSLQKRLMQRNKVLGASKDMQRAFSQYVESASWALADMTVGEDIGEALNDLQIADRLAKNNDDAALMSHVIKEINMRNRNAQRHAGGFTKWASRFGFTWYLFNASYSIMNSTQPMTLTLPYLGGEFGYVRAEAALLKAYGLVGGKTLKKVLTTGGGLGKLLGQDLKLDTVMDNIIDNVEASGDKWDAADMLKRLTEYGIIDGTFTLEIAEAARGADSISDGLIEIGRAVPHLVEITNRSTTALAAYNLLMERFDANKSGVDMAGRKALAIDAAIKAVRKTQFDYTELNRPRIWTKNDALRAMTMFKIHPLGVYGLFVGNFKKMLLDKNASSRDKVTAFKTLVGLFSTHAMLAGGAGSLLIEPVRAAMGLLALALDAVDDEDEGIQEMRWMLENPDFVMREILFDAVEDAELAEAMTFGLPRLAGIDMHNRIGLHNMLIMWDNGTPPSRWQHWFNSISGSILGPIFGMHNNFGRFSRMVEKNGVDARAWEALAPKQIRDIMRASRYSKEGMLDLNGNIIKNPSDFSNKDLMVRIIGFSPSVESESHFFASYVRKQQAEMGDTKSSLRREWKLADTAGARNRIWHTKIMPFNRNLPPELRRVHGITMASLRRSLRTDRKKERTRVAGTQVHNRHAAEYYRKKLSGMAGGEENIINR